MIFCATFALRFSTSFKNSQRQLTTLCCAKTWTFPCYSTILIFWTRWNFLQFLFFLIWKFSDREFFRDWKSALVLGTDLCLTFIWSSGFRTRGKGINIRTGQRIWRDPILNQQYSFFTAPPSKICDYLRKCRKEEIFERDKAFEGIKFRIRLINPRFRQILLFSSSIRSCSQGDMGSVMALHGLTLDQFINMHWYFLQPFRRSNERSIFLPIIQTLLVMIRH